MKISIKAISAILLIVIWFLCPKDGNGQDKRPVQVVPRSVTYSAVKIKKETEQANGKYKLDFEGDKLTSITIDNNSTTQPQELEINLGGFLRAKGRIISFRTDWVYDGSTTFSENYFFSINDADNPKLHLAIGVFFSDGESKRPVMICITDGKKTKYTLSGFD